MPFNAHVSIRSFPTWPVKPKSPPVARSRQTSIDLSNFGVPSPDDPDPFGVRALEEAGLMIKEAGTESRPSSEAFEFRPSPSSPVFRHSFQSADASSKRNSRRDSKRSTMSVDQGTQTTDLPSPLTDPEPLYMSPTQMAAPEIPSPIHENTRIEAWSASVQRNHEEQEEPSTDSKLGATTQRSSPLRESWTAGDPTYQDAGVEAHDITEQRPARQRTASQRLSDTLDQLERESLPRSGEQTPAKSSPGDEDEEEMEEPDDADVIVEQVVQVTPAVKLLTPSVVTPTVARAKLVTIKSRPAPSIPARNPARQRRARAVNGDSTSERLTADKEDESSSAYSLSPTRSAFGQSDDHASNQWSELTSLPDEASAKSRPESVVRVEESPTGDGVERKENGVRIQEDAGSIQTQAEEAEQRQVGESKPDISLADTVALALTPTNDSQLSNYEEPHHDSVDPSETMKLSAVDEPSTLYAPTVLSADKKPQNFTTAVHPAPAPQSDNLTLLADDKSPTTPHAPQIPFPSQPSTSSHTDAEIASLSDYDGTASHTDDHSQYDGDSEAFHSIPATPLNEPDEPSPTAEIEAMVPIFTPASAPVVG